MGIFTTKDVFLSKNKTVNIAKLCPIKQMHWSQTSNENKDNDFYACKDETRLAGPWTDKDSLYVPRQVREIVDRLYPWQISVRDMSVKWDTRSINLIYDPKGNCGKSTFCSYMVTHGLGELLPFCNNFKDIMRMAYDLPDSKCYIIDIPRGIKKTDLRGMFSGIEQLKNGYLFDDRYSFKRKFIDSPAVWVFVNKLPDPKYLSPDRWKYYTINCNKELKSISPQRRILPRREGSACQRFKGATTVCNTAL